MTRTGRRGGGWKGGESKSDTEKRRTNISRTCTKLLRHQAQNEHVPITKEGWVKASDLLAWKGLARFEPPVTLDELFDAIDHDRKFSKGRFGVAFIGDKNDNPEDNTGTIDVDNAATGEMTEMTADLSLNDNVTIPNPDQLASQQSESIYDTEAALAYHSSNPSTTAASYLIRAVQGHSIKEVGSEGLMTPITLEDPSSIPETVVHSTFHGAWPNILSSGGLKPMTRNMVHFAAGPAFSDIMPSNPNPNHDQDQDPNPTSTIRLKSQKDVQELLSRNNVVSGMRWDAQILIYIDIKRLLQDVAEKKWEMKWWRSENGVILTEGLEIPSFPTASNDETTTAPQNVTAVTAAEIETEEKTKPGINKGARKQKTKQSLQMTGRNQKLVPVEYFSAAVDIKGGMGVLWRAGEGVVAQLPDQLVRKGLPKSKGGLPGASAKKDAKPRVNVERDGDHVLGDEPQLDD